MDNPYWKTAGQAHNIDTESIRSICFELSSIIEASYSLASDLAATEPEDDQWPSASPMFLLHREMAEKTILRLLLQVSQMVRTYDDVMKESDHADAYLAHVKRTDSDDNLGSIEGAGKLNLREACNKIIHATEIRAIYDTVERSVPQGEPEPPGEAEDVWYLTGEMELKGSNRGKSWEGTLFVTAFIETILDRVNFQLPSRQ